MPKLVNCTAKLSAVNTADLTAIARRINPRFTPIRAISINQAYHTKGCVMSEEVLNPSDFHVGWLAQSLAGDIYVIVKATDKTVTFDKYDTVWLTVRRVRRKRFERTIEGGYFKDGAFTFWPSNFFPPENGFSRNDFIQSHEFKAVE